MENKTNLGGRSQSHQIDITEENLKRKCGGGYLDNVHWIFTGSCNAFVYDSVIPLNYWILVIKCIMLALEGALCVTMHQKQLFFTQPFSFNSELIFD